MKHVFYTSLHNLVILCIPQFSSADIVSIDSLSTQEALPFFIVFVPFSTLFLEFLIVGLLHLEFSNNNFTYSVHAFITTPPLLFKYNFLSSFMNHPIQVFLVLTVIFAFLLVRLPCMLIAFHCC